MEVEFKKIENIRSYVEERLQNGEINSGIYQKYGEIAARVGLVGEEIVTVMANGLEETKNTVTADENGNPDWVVTNPSGERYIVKDSVFRKRYDKIDGTENRFKPKWNPITAGRISESISFTAPWGESMNVVSGGYLVFTDMNDIYGIQEAEFNETYELVQC